jgi:hypothetical protein
MDKIYIISYKNRLLRIYSSRWEAEKYYYHVRDSLVNGEKFTRGQNDSFQAEIDLRLIAANISREGEELNMKLGNCHAGAGDPAIHYELCPV